MSKSQGFNNPATQNLDMAGFQILNAVITPTTTNDLSSTANTMTSNVNGIVDTAPIINSNVLNYAANNLQCVINGVASNTVTIAPGVSGITSINGDNTASQILAIGSAGNDYNLVDSGTGTHTFNLPTASAINTGKLSNTDWTTFNNKLNLSGGTMTGNILMGGNKVLSTSTPSTNADYTNKLYVDSSISTSANTKLNINGTNSMTGNLNMTGNQIVSLPDPVNGDNAVSLNYFNNNHLWQNNMYYVNTDLDALMSIANDKSVFLLSNNEFKSTTLPTSKNYLYVIGLNTHVDSLAVNPCRLFQGPLITDGSMFNYEYYNCWFDLDYQFIESQRFRFENCVFTGRFEIMQNINILFLENCQFTGGNNFSIMGFNNGTLNINNCIINSNVIFDNSGGGINNCTINFNNCQFQNATFTNNLTSGDTTVFINFNNCQGLPFNTYPYTPDIIPVLGERVFIDGTAKGLNNSSSLFYNNVEVTTGGGGGITSINGDTTAVQTFTTGLAGSDFNILDNLTGNHVLNLPVASAVNTGKLSNTDWNSFNNKVNRSGDTMTGILNMGANRVTSSFNAVSNTDLTNKLYVDSVVAGRISNNLLSARIIVGNASNIATAVLMTGDVSINNTGVTTIQNAAVNSAKIANDTILNTNVSPSAAIALSKIDVTNGNANGNINMNNNQLLNLGVPTLAQHAATKQYVDGLSGSSTQLNPGINKQPSVTTSGNNLVITMLNGSNLAVSVSNPVTITFRNKFLTTPNQYYSKTITTCNAFNLLAGSEVYPLGTYTTTGTNDLRPIYIYVIDNGVAATCEIGVSLNPLLHNQRLNTVQFTGNTSGDIQRNPMVMYTNSAFTNATCYLLGCFNSLYSGTAWLSISNLRILDPSLITDTTPWYNFPLLPSGDLAFVNASTTNPAPTGFMNGSYILFRLNGSSLEVKYNMRFSGGTTGVGTYAFLIPGLYKINTTIPTATSLGDLTFSNVANIALTNLNSSGFIIAGSSGNINSVNAYSQTRVAINANSNFAVTGFITSSFYAITTANPHIMAYFSFPLADYLDPNN